MGLHPPYMWLLFKSSIPSLGFKQALNGAEKTPGVILLSFTHKALNMKTWLKPLLIACSCFLSLL
jgi:hypothetical protein